MSLTKPSSPSSGTAQKGQMAWNASQPWGMGTCCQNLKQSKMLIGKQQERNQHIEMWLDEIQAKLNSRQCLLAAFFTPDFFFIFMFFIYLFFTPDYQRRSNSFAGADEILQLLCCGQVVTFWFPLVVCASSVFAPYPAPTPRYFMLGSTGQQCDSAWVDATQIHSGLLRLRITLGCNACQMQRKSTLSALCAFLATIPVEEK